ncbi:hypothetical protein SKAU_G00279250, partial [Synaphobranchus kaupii]
MMAAEPSKKQPRQDWSTETDDGITTIEEKSAVCPSPGTSENPPRYRPPPVRQPSADISPGPCENPSLCTDPRPRTPTILPDHGLADAPANPYLSFPANSNKLAI